MKAKTWIVLFLTFIIILLSICAISVYYVDPYFHYHKPHIDKFFYKLDNERSQNDGILKNFDYEGIITGTSMCQNFKTSEAETLFGIKFIKVPFSGGTYKEINDNTKTAIEYNDSLRIVIRGIDMEKIIEDKDAMRTDLGEYPTYLYDRNLLNDVRYVFNKGVMIRVLPMFVERIREKKEAGISSFDEYSNWMKSYKFGVNSPLLYPNGVVISNNVVEQQQLTDEERIIVEENIEKNLVETARENSNIEFYYFLTPYSAVWWKQKIDNGKLKKQIEAEKIAIEKMLEVDNIKVFSINDRFDITTDLNNYKDLIHYGEWINSLLLRYMYDGKYQLTKDNYDKYLAQEEAFYRSFDYQTEFSNQLDYEDDYYAAELIRGEIN